MRSKINTTLGKIRQRLQTGDCPRWIRFFIWIFACAGALAGQMLPQGGRWMSLGALAILLVLLLTTPRDAIRIPRWLSEVLILGGALAEQSFGHGANRWWMLVVTAALLLILRFTRTSAWWAALFAWLPI